MWSSASVHRYGRCSRAACLLNRTLFRFVCWSCHWYWLPRRELLFRQLTKSLASFSCARVLLLSDLPDLPGNLCEARSPTFCIRHAPAADRRLSWRSSLAAWPHCTCCQDRPMPFTYTHGFGMPVLATYMHSFIHAYMRTCIHAYMHTCKHAYIHAYIHTYRHT